MRILPSLLKALHKKYEGVIAEAEANIEVYLRNPAGIGEHPDIIAAVDGQFQMIAEAKEEMMMKTGTFAGCS